MTSVTNIIHAGKNFINISDCKTKEEYRSFIMGYISCIPILRKEYSRNEVIEIGEELFKHMEEKLK